MIRDVEYMRGRDGKRVVLTRVVGDWVHYRDKETGRMGKCLATSFDRLYHLPRKRA